MGITHFDQAPRRPLKIGHLQGTWSLLGEAAGCVGAGVRRIEVPAGGWSTPAHEHGRQEEIFYVLAGRGLSWQSGVASEIAAGDAIVYHAGRGAHTLHALEALDVLAFGPRGADESTRFPRLGLSLVGGRAVESGDGVADGFPIQFVREAALGAPAVPDRPAPRPATIVNVAGVEAKSLERPRVARTRRNLGDAAGSQTTGLQHVAVPPGKHATTQHCHSLEEEIFVILDGDGVLQLGKEETQVHRGHVIGRPPGTGVAHALLAGDHGLTFLAWGTREPGDVVYFPRSNKIWFRGVGVMGRIEHVDRWDGED